MELNFFIVLDHVFFYKSQHEPLVVISMGKNYPLMDRLLDTHATNVSIFFTSRKGGVITKVPHFNKKGQEYYKIGIPLKEGPQPAPKEIWAYTKHKDMGTYILIRMYNCVGYKEEPLLSLQHILQEAQIQAFRTNPRFKPEHRTVIQHSVNRVNTKKIHLMKLGNIRVKRRINFLEDLED